MKKAYNETWVANIHNQDVINDWHAQKLLTDEQQTAARLAFPVGFKQSNAFVKIGLFLFASIASSSSLGVISLFFVSIIGDSIYGYAIVSLIYGGGFLYVLEFFIKKENFYRSGVDNALLYAALGSIFGSFLGFSELDLPAWSYCLLALVVLIPALLRYADPLVAIGTYLISVAFCFLTVTKFPIGKVIIPFVIMFISAGSYWLMQYWRRIDTGRYYADNQDVISILALITFYLGGNYWVVREGNALLNDLSESVQIAFSPLFYFFTAAIPILYILGGLRKHDHKLIIVGMAVFTFSIFTYRSYFSTLPPEWALTISGVALVIGCILAIKLLKPKRFGLTYEPNEANKFKNLEVLILNQVMPQAPNQADQTQFGKGDFGGGGAGSGY